MEVISLTSNLGSWELGQRAEIEAIDTNHHAISHGRGSRKHKMAHLSDHVSLESWADAQFCEAP